MLRNLVAIVATVAWRSVALAIDLGSLFPVALPEVELPPIMRMLVLNPEPPSFQVSDIFSQTQYQRLRVVCNQFEQVSKCLTEQGVPKCTVDMLGRVGIDICPLPAAGKEQKEVLKRLEKDTALIQALVQILIPFHDHFNKCTSQSLHSKSASGGETSNSPTSDRKKSNKGNHGKSRGQSGG